MSNQWHKSNFINISASFRRHRVTSNVFIPQIMKQHISVVKKKSVFLFLEVSLWLCGLWRASRLYIHQWSATSDGSSSFTSTQFPVAVQVDGSKITATFHSADESLLCPTCFTQVAHLSSHFKTNYVAFSAQVGERLASFINQKPSDHGLTLSCICSGDEKLHVNWKDIIHIRSIPKIVLHYLWEMCSSLSVCGWKIPPGPQKQHIRHRRNH